MHRPIRLAAPVLALVAASLAGPLAHGASPAAQAPAPAREATETLAGDLAILDLPGVIAALESGSVTSEALVAAYLMRIRTYDDAGPRLNAVLSLNPDALAIARERDRDRAAGLVRGRLHGVPVLLKDNIETADPMPTTAGSLALAQNVNRRDAPLAAGLRAAGAIILGKTNLSEWANFRSTDSISGWSAVGGQTRNPYALARSACGSSSGSGVAASMGFAAGAVGTETNGSILCPSSMNGVVGVKPTVGLVSRSHIVPISSSQDTAGPMTRTVTGAAILLTAMAGSDGNDPATAEADARRTDYAAALTGKGLQGKRLGVLRFAQGDDPRLIALFDEAIAVMEAAGAETVEIEAFEPPDALWGKAFLVLKAEFKATLNAYLAGTTDAVTVRSLNDLMAFNTEHSTRELVLFDQDILEQSSAAPALDTEDYRDALATVRSATRTNGILALLKEHDVDLLVAPSRPPSFMIDVVHGDQYPGGTGADWMAAMAGYPNVTVPMGLLAGLPVGVSFMGPAWSEVLLLDAALAYEQGRDALAPPSLAPSIAVRPAIADAVDPPLPPQ
ncbi:MAG: amidase [Alphaproteobacteria bacterium]